MDLSRRQVMSSVVAAPLLLLPRKSTAQSVSGLNRDLLIQTTLGLQAAYHECVNYGFATDHTYNAVSALALALRGNFDSSGLTALIPGLNLQPSLPNLTAQTVWSAAESLGWSLPTPDILCVDIPSPNTATIRSALQYGGTLSNRILNLSDGLGGLATLTPVKSTAFRRNPVVRRYRLIYVADSGATTNAQKKAAIGVAGGTLLVAAGKELIAASGMTAMTAEASLTAIGIFSGGVACIVIGAAVAAYWGYQAAVELSGMQGGGGPDDGTDTTLLHVPSQPMLPL